MIEDLKMDGKEIVFHVNMEIRLNATSGDIDDGFLQEFMEELTIDIPENTPDDVYFMTRVIDAKCIKFGKAKTE
jgi:hypothetical protein